MATRRHGPFVQRDLVRADPRGAPFAVRQQPRHRVAVIVEHVPVHRHRVLHPHHELHIGGRGQPSVGLHLRRLMDVAEVKRLDLGLDVMGQHLGGQPVHQIGRVLIHTRRKVVRPDRQRRHVGPQRQHPAAFAPRPRPAPGRELNNHAGAVFLQPFLEAGEFPGVGTGGLIVVAHMGVADAGARLERLLRAFDLLGHGDRHRRVVLLARHRAGDRDADDAGLCHVLSLPFARQASPLVLPLPAP